MSKSKRISTIRENNGEENLQLEVVMAYTTLSGVLPVSSMSRAKIPPWDRPLSHQLSLPTKSDTELCNLWNPIIRVRFLLPKPEHFLATMSASAEGSGPTTKATVSDPTDASTLKDQQKPAAALEEDDEFEDFPVDGMPHSHEPRLLNPSMQRTEPAFLCFQAFTDFGRLGA